MQLATVLWDQRPTLAAAVGDHVLNVPACARPLQRSGQWKDGVPLELLALISGGPSALRAVQGVSRESIRRLRSGSWRAAARDPRVRPPPRGRVLCPPSRPP